MDMLLLFFQDSVLRAPTIGCMLMCLVVSMIGVLVVLQKRALIGEVLSHSIYPGVLVGLIFSYMYAGDDEVMEFFFTCLGALGMSCVTIVTINLLEKRYKVYSDAALTLTLTSFFGIGLLLLSIFQEGSPALYRKMNALLFGQAATMRDIHVLVYAVIAAVVVLVLLLFFRSFRVVLFDPTFAKMQGISTKKTEALLFFITVVCVIASMRSVGVVLLSGMLIFPAITALQWTKRLTSALLVAGSLGVISGFLGVVSSHEISQIMGQKFSLPTGPMIIVVAALFFLIALFVSKEGVVMRYIRRKNFSQQCEVEHLMKALFKHCTVHKTTFIPSLEFAAIYPVAPQIIRLAITKKFICRQKDGYAATVSGLLWGKNVLRLHRLWELYLVTYCNIAKERVHPTAEEMEHIITKDIERELTFLLGNPKKDPHLQPIPEAEDDWIRKSVLR